MKLELLNERQVKAFGTTLTIRDLTIGESLALQSVPEEEQMFTLVSKMIIEPKMSIKDIKDLPSKYINDITMLVEESQGKQ